MTKDGATPRRLFLREFDSRVPLLSLLSSGFRDARSIRNQEHC
jgi:hypothetical protein